MDEQTGKEQKINQRATIEFNGLKGKSATEIYQRIIGVYGESYISFYCLFAKQKSLYGKERGSAI